MSRTQAQARGAKVPVDLTTVHQINQHQIFKIIRNQYPFTLEANALCKYFYRVSKS